MQPWFIAYAEDIDDGSPYYLTCPDCSESAVPPRAVCPNCGERTLEERPLSETATVEVATTIHSSIPAFEGETPYTVVIGAFEEGIKLTGQLRGVESVETGETVEIGAEEREHGWILTFSPTG